MLTPHEDYRQILKRELARRIAANARYSLRAFARDAGISSSRMSEILNRKQGLSRKAAIQVARKLGFASGETRYFAELAESQHGRSSVSRKIAASKAAKLREAQSKPLQMENFQLISDWQHFAIMELTRVRGFESDSEWIAGRLGISVVEVEDAVERLIRTGILARDDRTLRPVQDKLVASPTEIPSHVIKSHHHQILRKAERALYTQAVESRDFSTLTLAIPSAKIPEVKALLKTFRRKLTKILAESDDKDSVYCLATQFFALEERTR